MVNCTDDEFKPNDSESHIHLVVDTAIYSDNSTEYHIDIIWRKETDSDLNSVSKSK